MGNKKGNIGFVFCLFIILIASFCFFHLIITSSWESRNNACIELGYEKWDDEGGFDFCKDFDGDLYYIDFYDEEHKYGIIPKSIKVREITVGYVETIGDKG